MLPDPCRGGGIGRHAGFKIRWGKTRVGSSPTLGTTNLIYSLGYLTVRFPIITLTIVLLVLAVPGKVYAWGEDSHQVIGVLAMQQIDEKAKKELVGILGSISREQIAAACIWADVVRPTPQWEHTYPWHYINQPRWSDEYVRERDCADGNCLTERIKWAANRLGDNRLTRKERQQSFNFLCHFVGDLHEPMHTAYADDLGGNEFAVEYNGMETDLHTLWDHHFIESIHPSWLQYTDELAGQMPAALTGPWSPSLIDRWTDESRAHVKEWMYPETREISCSYERRALPFIDQQLRLAGNRLAWILNSVLGNGEVQLPGEDSSPAEDH